MLRLLVLVALVLVGCFTQPRSLVEEAAPPLPFAAASSIHYRTFADADALTASLRYVLGRTPLVSAHRGGPGPFLPENALVSFEHALDFAPALVEVDVRTASDGTLVLLHDETLDRTTTGKGLLADRTLPDLRRLRLVDPLGRVTPYRIPTLAEALAWAESRAVLLLDVKQGVDFETLVSTIREADASNRVVVIAYTLDDLLAFYDRAPDLVYSATAETPVELDALLSSRANSARLILFAGVGSVDPAVIEQAHAAGLMVQVGTFGETDAAAFRRGPSVYDDLLDAGVDVLATDAVPIAALAVRRVP